jgi:hypothetical protein
MSLPPWRMLSSSLLIDFFNQILKMAKGTENMLLAAFMGRSGLGLDGLLRGKLQPAARSDRLILNKYLGVSVGWESCSLILSSFRLQAVFRQLDASLWLHCSLYFLPGNDWYWRAGIFQNGHYHIQSAQPIADFIFTS